MKQSQFYHRDGRFSPFMIVPLLPISIVVSIAMAVALFALQGSWYYFIITPLVVSLPVLGMTYVTLHFGRCRNIVMAILTGLLLFGAYYAGFWLIDYAMFYQDYGEEGLQAVERMGGSRGPVGYFHFRCKTTVVEDATTGSGGDEPDPVGGYLFYGAEWLIFLGLAIGLPLSLSRRVYYKDLKQWGTSTSYVLHKEDGVEAFRAIVDHDWRALAKVPKMPPTTQGIRVRLCRLKFEYAKGNPEAPIYVSLFGLGRKDIRDLSLEREPPKRILSSGSIKQWAIEPESGKVLAHHFPELGLKVPVPEGKAETNEESSLGYGEVDLEPHPSRWKAN